MRAKTQKLMCVPTRAARENQRGRVKTAARDSQATDNTWDTTSSYKQKRF